MEIENQNTGPVKFDDVNSIMIANGLDPRATNAGAVRLLLGRGSLATIQKHLETLRTSSEPAHTETFTAAPVAPRELVESIWREAWLQAQARLGSQIVRLTDDRDAARISAASRAADAEALSIVADQCVEASELASAAVSAATADSQAAQLAAEKFKKELEDLSASTTAAASAAAASSAKELEIVMGDAAAAAAAAEKDAAASVAAIRAEYELKIARQDTQVETLKGVIDRLGGQLAEVKSLLHREAQPKNQKV